jgi:phosphatidylglycerol---prolipoprotein diacylglyceryl transferase
MFPSLFDSVWIGLDGDLSFRIPTYFAAIVIGFGLAALLAKKDAEKFGLDGQAFTDFLIWMMIAGILGGRFFHVIFDGFLLDYVHLCTNPFAMDGKALLNGNACVSNQECLALQEMGRDVGSICRPDDGRCYPQQDCFRWLKFWAGGLTVYGSLITCAIATTVFAKRYGVSVRKMMDFGGYGIPLGICIGRLGCLGAGCCFGDVCDVEWMSMRFPVGTLAYQHHFDHFHTELTAQWQQGIRESLPVWPTQLISSAYCLAIFLFTYFIVRPRKRFDGQVMIVSVMLYAICRSLVELIRADPRGAVAGFSTSQIIAVVTTAVAVTVLVRMRSSEVPSSHDETPSGSVDGQDDIEDSVE